MSTLSLASLAAPAVGESANTLRPDLKAIADLVPLGAKTLDLGCGDGALLEFLVRQRGVLGRGVELSEEGVLACVRRGLRVRQCDLHEGLADYPDHSFERVILAQTLPFLDNPADVLHEMLRVGKQAIVSFPNWGYWRCRLDLLITGRIPVAPDLPQAWHESPRRQPFTITDFAHFCSKIKVGITREVYLDRGNAIEVRRFKNLRATTAVFVLNRANHES